VNDFKNTKAIKSGGKKKEADFPDALVVNKAVQLRRNMQWQQAP